MAAIVNWKTRKRFENNLLYAIDNAILGEKKKKIQFDLKNQRLKWNTLKYFKAEQDEISTFIFMYLCPVYERYILYSERYCHAY